MNSTSFKILSTSAIILITYYYLTNNMIYKANANVSNNNSAVIVLHYEKYRNFIWFPGVETVPFHKISTPGIKWSYGIFRSANSQPYHHCKR